MYRLVLYLLMSLLFIAVIFSFFNLLPFNPILLIFSSLFLVFFCGFVNEVFSETFKAATNVESVYITALILALIITPAKSIPDFVFLAWVAILAMSSKYILAIGNKHIFNPVAIAVFLTAMFIGRSASWWVGNLYLFPFVALGGYLIVRKTRKEKMALIFIAAVMITTLIFSLFKSSNLILVLKAMIFHSSLFFFAAVMLTEPMTMPSTAAHQNIFAVLTGVLFSPAVHLGNIYFTPEMALLVGNIYAYAVSPKEKFIFRRYNIIQLSKDTLDFVFPLAKKLSFVPGQYMEWTLPHPASDARGIRRYFTLASSPTEDNLRIGVKFYSPASTYKKAMVMRKNNCYVAAQRAGDFVLPLDRKRKLVFLAGGIGVTPFRSMLKYLIDKNEARDIVVFYSNKTHEEIIYQDVLEAARKKLNVKVICTLTAKDKIPVGWTGEIGRVSFSMITKYVPDFSERLFYLSGPHSLVTGFENVLKQMGINRKNIKTDFFPGFV